MNRTLLLAMFAACQGHPQQLAEQVPVPLTAATSSVALQQIAREDVTPPWSLTASDGSGLALSRVDAKAVFEGPIAYTELHLYFHNAENRRREGTFQITLPAHAAVSRFAMENDGQMMEAEVVEKQLARRAYDDFLHRKQDPALLEKGAGNQFTAKVFPIAPNSDKHLVISFSQTIPGAQYVLPLKGLPKIAQVDVALSLVQPDGTRSSEHLNQRDWTPDHDFQSQLAAGAAAVGAGNLVAAQVQAFAETTGSTPPTELSILVDTSASRALGYAGYIERLHGMITKLGNIPVQVIAFDQDSEQIYSGPATAWGAAQDKQLVERGAAGASDLGQALALIDKERALIVTDGVITAGREHAELAALVKASKAKRFDVALAGGIRDDAAATALVTALPAAGSVLDLDAGVDGVIAALGEPVATDVKVSVAGAAWVYPAVIPSLRRGQSATVYARMAQPTQQLAITIGPRTQKVGVVAGTAPLVERAVAEAEIEEMDERLTTLKGDEAKALKKQIADKSIAARVVSSQTSLLVLESDGDYARYGIERNALADILEVGEHGLERHHRAALPQLAAPTQKIAANKNDGVAEKKKQLERADKAPEKPEAKPDPMGSSGKDDFKGGVEGGVAGGDVAGEIAAPAEEAKESTGASNGVAMGSGAGPGAAPPAPPPAAQPMMVRRPPADAVSISTGARRRHEVEAEADDGEAFAMRDVQQQEAWPPPGSPVALTGEMQQIAQKLSRADVDGALTQARDWHAKDPGNVLALLALGDALEAKHALPTAARIYGSIIDLYPARADLRRFAGERLARVAAKTKDQHLIVDTYERAVADRPDHLTGHRLLAYAYVRANRLPDAFQAILAAIDTPYRNDSYRGGERVLADDAGMIGAALIAADGSKSAMVKAELDKRHLTLAKGASTRFILYWETDGNDVDFHIQDARGGHAWYSSMHLPSGGDLYADITTGYGPECFAINGKPSAGPYRLSINYYSQGPMGYGMGLLEAQKFDGKTFSFDERPYVIMNDHAYVDLGKFQ